MDNGDHDFARFLIQIKGLTGIDLSQYKEAQMKRRLTALRTKLGYSSFDAYYHAIVSDKKMLYEFLDRMTINVSEFWRNPNRWVVLQNRFLPELAANRSKMKVWSAACSTGEEPYTLAMILKESGLLGTTSITASDIDDGVLEKAKQGIYMDRSIRDVPAICLQKYFFQENSLYHVKSELKQAVHFVKQDLLADSFDTQYDLIICRNVMIYFTEDAKQKLYQKFSDALRPGGLLFVGSTEQIFTPGRFQFELADTFFYRKLPS